MFNDSQNILLERMVAREKIVCVKTSSVMISERGIKLGDMSFTWFNLTVK